MTKSVLWTGTLPLAVLVLRPDPDTQSHSGADLTKEGRRWEMILDTVRESILKIGLMRLPET